MEQVKFQIFYANKLEDVYSIESTYNKKSIWMLFLMFMSKLSLLFCNLILYTLKIVLFGVRPIQKEELKSLLLHMEGAIGDIAIESIFLKKACQMKEIPSITVLYNGGSSYDAACAQETIKSLCKIGSFDFFHTDSFFQLITKRKPKINELKLRNFDLYVCLNNFCNWGGLSTALKEIIFAKLAGCRNIVGFELRALYLKGLFLPVISNFVENYPRHFAGLARYISLESGYLDALTALECDNRDILIRRLKEKGIDLDRPLVVINPSAQYSWKRWPVDRFAKLASLVSERYNAQIVVTGIQREREMAEVVSNAAGKSGFNLAGETSIPDLINLLRVCKVCITNDTGVMHLAAYAGTPTVAVFSMTQTPKLFFPMNDKVEVVFSFSKCALCYRHGRYWSRCPNPVSCLTAISVEDVEKAFNKIWSRI